MKNIKVHVTWLLCDNLAKSRNLMEALQLDDLPLQ